MVNEFILSSINHKSKKSTLKKRVPEKIYNALLKYLAEVYTLNKVLLL
jgi:hypothetical protein